MPSSPNRRSIERLKATRPAAPFPRTYPPTLGQWLAFAEKLYADSDAALGQIATHAHDEALYLILHSLGMSLDSPPSVLKRRIRAAEHDALVALFRRRLIDKTPAAYLTHEAWLGGQKFYVDERVLIPRSYFLELIGGEMDRWIKKPKAVRRVVDVCTGSGCLAILLAQHFPKAMVDAVDLSPEALAVAEVNVREFDLPGRITLLQSDVFDSVPKAAYDVILSNPPYEPASHCDKLAAEFKKEPRLALDGGADGLFIIRKLLLQSRDRLTPDGIVVVEVGGLHDAVEKEFSALEPHWLPTEDGSDCVFLVQASRLRSWRPTERKRPRK